MLRFFFFFGPAPTVRGGGLVVFSVGDCEPVANVRVATDEFRGVWELTGSLITSGLLIAHSECAKLVWCCEVKTRCSGKSLNLIKSWSIDCCRRNHEYNYNCWKNKHTSLYNSRSRRADFVRFKLDSLIVKIYKIVFWKDPHFDFIFNIMGVLLVLY